MITVTQLYRSAGLAAAMILVHTATFAQVTPDEPAGAVVYPYIAVDMANGTDTLIQLSNTSDATVDMRCFYEDFTPECTDGQPGESCVPAAVTCTGTCLPRDARISFHLRATAHQPLAWHASTGLTELPLDGVARVGPLGASNQPSNVPGVGAGPFVGTLRCVAVSSDLNRPLFDNVLIGQATLERSAATPIAYADAAQYRALGIRVLRGPNNDEFLNLGGGNAEYEACPGIGLVEHFFDGATLQTGDVNATVRTTLVLANCTANFVRALDNVVQFLVFNEFAQRFTTSRDVPGQLVVPLSQIDSGAAGDPERSIFSSAVAGTLTGRTTVYGIMSGLHMVTIESHRDPNSPERVQSDALNAHSAGTRPAGDILAFRAPRCIGDCDLDGNVSIDELITGVNIALNTLPIDACRPIDADYDSAVTVDEIVSAVNGALSGCPDPVLPSSPTPLAPPTPTTSPTPASVGPEITHLGFATADDRPLPPDSTDEMGRAVFVRPFGQGMTLLIEARPGQSQSPVGQTTYSATGELPDVQVIVSRPLGDGDPTVCEHEGRSGGIPAVPTLDFAPIPATVAAINDLGCRAFDTHLSPRIRACTRTSAGTFAMVSGASQSQFCIPIAKAWAFPVGDTVVAARVRDDAGNLGPVREIVVRVVN